MKIGLVGIPNAGKSTLFNTFVGKAQALVANYAFCTIDPNKGKVPVQDPRLNALANAANTKIIVPTGIDVVDIAGLIKGASTGQGLGNEFLENIRNVDLILHIVRYFDDPSSGDPATFVHDIEVIETELILSDIQRIERYLAKNKRDPQAPLLQQAMAKLNNGERLVQHFPIFQELGLLSIKPKIIIANMQQDQLTEYEQSGVDVREYFGLDRDLLVCDAQVSDHYIDNIVKHAYSKLNLITFFTAGEKEARAWTAHRDQLLYLAASAIHNDFTDKFIKADVVSYADFIACGGWTGAKHKGKLRVEGKKYVLQDGDVCLFRINT